MAGFEGFKEIRIPVRSSIVGELEIYAKVKGKGPGLLLIHGYPQSHQLVLSSSPSLSFHPLFVSPPLDPHFPMIYLLPDTPVFTFLSLSSEMPTTRERERADGQYVE